jgi:hypothetical protein
MADVTLEFLGAQMERLFTAIRDQHEAISVLTTELRDFRRETRTALAEIDADLASLARVMLRLQSRVHDLEKTGA